MSRYQALAEQTQQLIDDGILRAGDRLPSIRQACRTHDISPVTVMQAYYLLENRGLIEARPTGNQSSAMLSSLVQADAVLLLDHDQGDLAAGTLVRALPLHGLL